MGVALLAWNTLTMILSIITPTIGNLSNLERLFASLRSQDVPHDIEVILSATNISKDDLFKKLPSLPKNYVISIIESSVSGIAVARNRALVSARGKYIFFLDDDCILPHTLYLNQALQRLLTSDKHAFAGSYIIDDPTISFSSAFYNYVSHLWLMSFFDAGQLRIILGGCAFFSKHILIDCAAYFEETSNKAAEEFAFCQNLIANGVPIEFVSELSVYHNPSCTVSTLLKKAWAHGRALGTYRNVKTQTRWITYLSFFRCNARQALGFLPMMILFLAAGRLAFLFRRLEGELQSTRKPSLKRS